MSRLFTTWRRLRGLPSLIPPRVAALSFIAMLLIGGSLVWALADSPEPPRRLAKGAVINTCTAMPSNPKIGDSVVLKSHTANLRAGGSSASLYMVFHFYDDVGEAIGRLIHDPGVPVAVGDTFTFVRAVTAGDDYLPQGKKTTVVCGLWQNDSGNHILQEHSGAKGSLISPVVNVQATGDNFAFPECAGAVEITALETSQPEYEPGKTVDVAFRVRRAGESAPGRVMLVIEIRNPQDVSVYDSTPLGENQTIDLTDDSEHERRFRWAAPEDAEIGTYRVAAAVRDFADWDNRCHATWNGPWGEAYPEATFGLVRSGE